MFLLKILLLLITIVTFCYFGIDEDKCFGMNKKQLYTLIPFFIFLIMCTCVKVVPANTVGIRWSAINGTSNKTLDEGVHFKSPADKIYLIDTTTQERTIKNVTIQTKDAQFVKAKINVKFRVNKKNAYNVFKGYGDLDSLKQNIISNYAQKSVENVVSQYNVIETLGEKKNEIYSKSTERLSKMLQTEGVSLVQLTIKDMNAGDEIEKAIADEAVAKKKVETAEQRKLKAQKDAETKIIKAKAQAEANEILTDKLTDKVLMNEWLKKWDGKLPKYVDGDSSNVMIGLDELN